MTLEERAREWAINPKQMYLRELLVEFARVELEQAAKDCEAWMCDKELCGHYMKAEILGAIRERTK